MKQFVLKFAPFIIVWLAIFAAFAPVVEAQDLGTRVQISTTPDGPYYMVDGMNYQHATSAVWPTGSKHLLAVQSMVQNGVTNKARYTFQNWTADKSTLPGGNVVTITADPALSSIVANFSAEYALTLVFGDCPDPSCAAGKIYADSTAYTSSAEMWSAPGTVVTLLAVPNAGYVFDRWEPGPNQVIQGPLNKVTLNTPTMVYPRFQVARKVNITTDPPGLNVYADRIQVPTPTSLDWGWSTIHSVGAVTPQVDKYGTWWVFNSWSDGGAPTHAYTVAASNTQVNLTANYVRGTAIAFQTSPPGLKLMIDGRDNWLSYGFVWGIGETHHVQAPAKQTDSQGRTWTFSSWSNGGAESQDITVPAEAVDQGGMRFTATYSALGRMVINSSMGVSVKVDGTDCATPCTVERPAGTAVQVSAPASVAMSEGARADFMGWPGSGTTKADWTYTLNADPLNLNLDFHVMNRLVAAADPPEGASWRIQPSSPDGYYDAQAVVTLNVAAQPGFRFRSWDGDLTGNKPNGVLLMSSPRAVQARLDRVPYIAPAGLLNGAGSTPQSGVAAGSVLSIFGASLAPATTTGPLSPMAQTLEGVTVKLADRLLPLFFVSPGQINAQLPDDVQPGDQTLTVSAEGMPDVQARFTVVRNAPGLFPQMVDEQAYAISFHEDGSLVTADAPARHGETLTVYGTGFGPADRVRPVGFPIPLAPAFTVVDPATVKIGDIEVPAEAFAVPGKVAIDAVRFKLADDVPSGDAQLVVRINGQDSNTVLLIVQ
jgi:uncharacterized protein (TIGR03437 family)